MKIRMEHSSTLTWKDDPTSINTFRLLFVCLFVCSWSFHLLYIDCVCQYILFHSIAIPIYIVHKCIRYVLFNLT